MKIEKNRKKMSEKNTMFHFSQKIPLGPVTVMSTEYKSLRDSRQLLPRAKTRRKTNWNCKLI